MTITTRAGKGSQLTHAELDTNFTDLRDGVSLQVPKTTNTGIKVDSLGTPTFGWHDLLGSLVTDPDDANRAVYTVYQTPVRQLLFIEAVSEAFIGFHMPHDYLPNSDIFIHAHWSHNSTIVTGGSVTFKFDCSYSKGHNQAAFSSSVPISVIQNASTTQYQHMIAETAASVSGGSGVQLDTDDLEVDGLLLVRVTVDSNDITSSGAIPDVFIHAVDLHYQSTGVPTKQRAPDFYT